MTHIFKLVIQLYLPNYFFGFVCGVLGVGCDDVTMRTFAVVTVFDADAEAGTAISWSIRINIHGCIHYTRITIRSIAAAVLVMPYIIVVLI